MVPLLSVGAFILIPVLYLVIATLPDAEKIFVSDVLFAVVSSVPAGVGLLMVRRYGVRSRLGVGFFGLSLGALFYALGEITWMVLEAFLGISIPFPSVADVFYVSAYPFLAMGLLTYYLTFRVPLTKTMWAIVLLVIVGAVGTTFQLLFAPLLTESADLLTKTLDLAYPALDMVLIVLALLGIAVFRTSMMGRVWFLMNASLILFAVSDLLFSYTTLLEVYYSGHPLEIFWLWGYIGLALAFYQHRKLL